MFWLVVFTCFNHLEKYEFVNGKDDIPYSMEKNVPNHQPVILFSPKNPGASSMAIVNLVSIKMRLYETDKPTCFFLHLYLSFFQDYATNHIQIL